MPGTHTNPCTTRSHMSASLRSDDALNDVAVVDAHATRREALFDVHDLNRVEPIEPIDGHVVPITEQLNDLRDPERLGDHDGHWRPALNVDRDLQKGPLYGQGPRARDFHNLKGPFHVLTPEFYAEFSAHRSVQRLASRRWVGLDEWAERGLGHCGGLKLCGGLVGSGDCLSLNVSAHTHTLLNDDGHISDSNKCSRTPDVP